MVDSSAQALNRIFRALADPTRREILSRVSAGVRTVTELAEPFDMSLAGVSKHLRVLEEANLIQREWVGREARCRLNPAPLAAADRWLHRYRAFWEPRLDRLDELLRKRAKKEKQKP